MDFESVSKNSVGGLGDKLQGIYYQLSQAVTNSEAGSYRLDEARQIVSDISEPGGSGPLTEIGNHLEKAANHLEQAAGYLMLTVRQQTGYMEAIGFGGESAVSGHAGNNPPTRPLPCKTTRQPQAYTPECLGDWRPIVNEEIPVLTQLSPEQIKTIAARVRVRVVFASHGRPRGNSVIPEAGLVLEKEYNAADDVLAAIDARKGDVLATELGNHEENNGPGNVSRAGDWLAETEAGVSKLRREKKLSAFGYARERARIASVPSFYVDASESDLQQWRETNPLTSVANTLMGITTGVPLLDTKFRERRAAAKIASLAERMSRDDYYPDSDDKPTLTVLFGWGHARRLSAAIKEAGIEAEIETTESFWGRWLG